MIKLKKLLKRKEAIYFIVERKDREKFLNYCKNSGCYWKNGDFINPTKDKTKCTYLMAILDSHSLLLDSVVGSINHSMLQGLWHYRFTDICEDKLLPIKNGIINKKEDKNELPTSNKIENDELENQLLVCYCNDDELLCLFNLLEEYGYKNIHNLNPSTLKCATHVFCIDNREKWFTSLSTNTCGAMNPSKPKYLKYEELEKIFKVAFNIEHKLNIDMIDKDFVNNIAFCSIHNPGCIFDDGKVSFMNKDGEIFSCNISYEEDDDYIEKRLLEDILNKYGFGIYFVGYAIRSWERVYMGGCGINLYIKPEYALDFYGHVIGLNNNEIYFCWKKYARFVVCTHEGTSK